MYFTTVDIIFRPVSFIAARFLDRNKLGISSNEKKHIITLHAFYFFYVFGWDEVRRQLFKPEYVFSLQRLTNHFAISAYILFIGRFYANYLFIMPAFF